MAFRVLQSGPANSDQCGNHLVKALHASDREALDPYFRRVDFGAGHGFAGRGDDDVTVFPLSLVVSIVQAMPDGRRFEIGLIGREGMFGWPMRLGAIPFSSDGVAQLGGGSALTISAARLAELCDRRPTLQATLLAFTRSFTDQMSHTIVANLRDGIDRRLARWLLMLHDRVDGDVLAVTHGELAATLNVRRASVTDALHVMEGNHVVRCTRGILAVRDRAALAAAAGDSYGPPEAGYRASLGAFGKS